jgi:hypothetical protein
MNLTVDGKVVAKLENGVLTKSVVGSKHQLKHPPAWAVDKNIIDKFQFDRIQIYDKESQILYWQTKEIFLEKAQSMNRGFGAQYYLELPLWEVEYVEFNS